MLSLEVSSLFGTLGVWFLQFWSREFRGFGVSYHRLRRFRALGFKALEIFRVLGLWACRCVIAFWGWLGFYTGKGCNLIRRQPQAAREREKTLMAGALANSA